LDRLNELRKDILTMDPEELREHIRKLRADRRVTKERPAARVQRKVKSEKAKSSAAALLDGMSEDEIAALMKELGHADQGNPTEGDQSQG